MQDTGCKILDAGYLIFETFHSDGKTVWFIFKYDFRLNMIFDIWNKFQNMSYKNLEIWKLSRDMVIEVHQMSLSLPKFEQFEKRNKYEDQVRE